MTWRELAEKIQSWDEQEQLTDVTVWQDEEYYPVKLLAFCYDGVLDYGHPYLII